MAILVELGDDGEPLADPNVAALEALSLDEHMEATEHSAPLFAALFSCFPIVAAITSRLDLNDVDALASTCRQVRANLLCFRSHIVSHTLHCDEDGVGAYPCARDLVNFCRRAGCPSAVCRNCDHRISHFNRRVRVEALQNRLRKLCYFCQTAPLNDLDVATHALPIGVTYCQCDAHLRELCASCHNEVKQEIMSGPFSISYYVAVFWRRLEGIILGKFKPINYKDLRHDGVPCARGQFCVAAGISTATEPLEPCSGSGYGGPLASDFNLYTGFKNVVGASIFEADAVLPSHDLHQGVPAWGSREVDVFLRPEKEGWMRGWCAFCHKIVPSEEDKKLWNLDRRR